MGKDRTILNTWIAAISILLIVGAWSYFDYQKSVDAAQAHKVTQDSLQKELLEKTSCVHHVDSLEKINDRLSRFESLTMAMVHREDATGGLKYEVGDIVMLKSDSSRVVIEDILIGGGKYNYFIKYRVLFKDDARKEVTPEMIF